MEFDGEKEGGGGEGEGGIGFLLNGSGFNPLRTKIIKMKKKLFRMRDRGK